MIAPIMDSTAASAGLAIDSKSLAQLRTQAKHSPETALKAAAQQFEAVFLNMMMKSMREATPQNGMFDNEHSKLFTGMLDQQFSQTMASKGIGLADSLVKQLSRSSATDNDVDDIIRQSVTTVPAKVSSQSYSIPSSYTENLQQDFVGRMLPYALQASRAGGVPPQLMLAQAALETGWGKREIRMADGSNSYNVFAIKAGVGWNGKIANVTTTEYESGEMVKRAGSFRAYASYDEAFKDYAHLISTNPRYAKVLQKGGDAADMAHVLQQGGYATDPHYAEKLSQLMSKINIAT